MLLPSLRSQAMTSGRNYPWKLISQISEWKVWDSIRINSICSKIYVANVCCTRYVTQNYVIHTYIILEPLCTSFSAVNWNSLVYMDIYWMNCLKPGQGSYHTNSACFIITKTRRCFGVVVPNQNNSGCGRPDLFIHIIQVVWVTVYAFRQQSSF